MASDDPLDPVLASSNRYADIGPYTKKLFADDPNLWGQVLPWEFPQQGNIAKEIMKAKEEDFLRGFFDEREIRMQGGADGEGNGFRFLKQAWYAAALWNLHHRLPAVVNWWFEHNQEILRDQSMQEHFFAPGVKPSTFFEATEIALYGEKFLGWAIKQIQFLLDPELAEIANQAIFSSGKADANSPKDTTPQAPMVPSSNGGVKDMPIASATTEQQQNMTPHPTSSAKLAATAKPYNFTPQGGPSTAPTQLGRSRNLSGNAKPAPEQRDCKTRIQRESFSNRPSFNEGLPNFQQVAYHGGPTYRPGHFARQGGSSPVVTFGSYAPVAVPRGRGPTRGTPSQPIPPPPQSHTFPGPHLSPYQHGGPTPAMGGHFGPPNGPPVSMPTNHQQGPPLSGNLTPGGFQTQTYPAVGHAYHPFTHMHPLVDKSNFPGANVYGEIQSSLYMGGKGDARAKRERTSSRGGKGRGYGSLRGKGSHGRNTFAQQGGTQSVHGGELFDPNATCDPGSVPRSRRFSSLRASDLHNPNRRTFIQDENIFPPGLQQPIGQMLGPNGQYFTAHYPPHRQSVPSAFDPNHGGKRRGYPTIKQQAPCMLGCDGDTIGEKCRTAMKLILFGLPPEPHDKLKADIQNFCGQFGEVTFVSPLKTCPAPSALAYVTFGNVAGARECMAQSRSGACWPDGRPLRVQNAKEHWDREHHRYSQGHASGSSQENPGPTSETSALPSVQGLPASAEVKRNTDFRCVQSQINAAAAFNSSQSASITPTHSRTSTPKKQKNKPQKKRKQRQQSSQESIASGIEAAVSRQDSFVIGLEAPKPEISTQQESKAELPQETTSIPQALAAENASSLVEQAVDTKELTSPTISTAEDLRITEEFLSKPVEHAIKPRDQAPEVPEPLEGSVVQEVHTTLKPEDETIDDSFHTPVGSPEQEVGGPSRIDEAVTLSCRPTPQMIEGDVMPIVQGSPVKENKENVDDGASEKLPVASRAFKKAPIPQLPKPRNVSIVLPPSKDKVSSSGTISGTEPTTVQRQASSSSDVPNLSFVTAPNTPALPAAHMIPEPSSAKQLSKQKGPEQTESLSVFGKKKQKKEKRPKKTKSGSIRGLLVATKYAANPATDSKMASHVVNGVSIPIMDERRDDPVPIAFLTPTQGGQDDTHDQFEASTAANEIVDSKPEQALVSDTLWKDDVVAEGPHLATSRRGTVGVLKSSWQHLWGGRNSQAPQPDAKAYHDDAAITDSVDGMPGLVTSKGVPSKATAHAAQHELQDQAQIQADPSAQLEVEHNQDAVGLGISGDEPDLQVPKKKKPKKKSKKKAATTEVEQSVVADNDGGATDSDDDDIKEPPEGVLDRIKHPCVTDAVDSIASTSTGEAGFVPDWATLVVLNKLEPNPEVEASMTKLRNLEAQEQRVKEPSEKQSGNPEVEASVTKLRELEAQEQRAREGKKAAK